jgi:rod shape-determining protein MreB and related proteins
MTTFYVGVDLGTSRTSIATSTGKRFTIDTCVGYPKDVISQKRFGKPYLLGDEAIQNRLALNMVWPLADGVITSGSGQQVAIEAVKLILTYLLNHVFGDRKKGDTVYAAIGVPAQASMESKKGILNAIDGIVDKVLVVSEPFMVAYGMDIFDEALIVDVGAGTVDLCRIHGTLPEPEDQISLTTAGNYFDERITHHLLEQFPSVQVTKQIIRQMKEKLGYAQGTQNATYTLTEEGKPKPFDVGEVLSAAITEVVTPICEAVQKLVAEFDPEFQEKLRNNILVAGGGSRLRGIDRAIEDALVEYGGGSARCTEDPEYGGAVGALKMALEMPEDLWEKI